MSAAAHPSSPPKVIVVGPDPALLGGMAGVIAQILALDFDGRYRVQCVPITLSDDERESVFRRLCRHVEQLLALWRKLRRDGPTIVHLHTCSGFSFYRSVLDLALARWAGCRVILHVHGAAFDVFHGQAGRLGRRIIRGALSRADRVVALSEGWRCKLRAIAPAARITRVENAIEAPAEFSFRGHEGACRFLMLARMDAWKGVDDLLEASSRLKDDGAAFEVTLAGPKGSAGDGDELGRKIRARNLEGIVQYIGPVEGARKRALFEWADVYVQPSRHEGMPLSILEALSWGLPVVATRVGAVPEVIEDGRQGLVVPSGRPDQLASAMGEMAADAGLRLSMAQAGRELIQRRFSLARLRDDLCALYDQILAPQVSPQSLS